MQYLDTSTTPEAAIRRILTGRSAESMAGVENSVHAILKDVIQRGDEAVVEHTRTFDWPGAAADTLEVPRTELEEALRNIDPELLSIIELSAKNIEAFHKAEMGRLQSWMMTPGPGEMLGQIIQPMERAGIYVPGGKAFYPSTVLMAAIPARVAGVKEILLCTPARKDGSLHPLVMALAAKYADRVFKVGGAQAIGAMAYGAGTIPKVDVIAGPGNDYVNTAKRIVNGTVAIDMLAGPSEVGIVADSGANPRLVAADLLAQTEHGPENRGFLFSPSSEFLESCRKELTSLRSTMSRQDILMKTDENLAFIKTANLDEAVELSNALAPEHLELCVREPLALLGAIRNAGAILFGEYTSAPAGDYIAGPSHTLPTAGTARFSSPLSCNTFIKRSSVLYHDKTVAAKYAENIGRFADLEGFDAHAAAARLRPAESEKAQND
jgi:histidinol dehydrogenase